MPAPACLPRGQNPRAFTLIELLVVIAIVAVIAAILLPVFQRVRENARRAACLSNLRQVTLGLLQYSQDADDRCPLYFSSLDSITPGSRTPGHGNATAPPYLYWNELVAPYVQTQGSHNFNAASKVFVCPDAPYDAAAIAEYPYFECVLLRPVRQLGGVVLPGRLQQWHGASPFVYGSARSCRDHFAGGDDE